nr:family 1 glycosylhydrolase [Gordonia jinhuaensis]
MGYRGVEHRGFPRRTALWGMVGAAAGGIVGVRTVIGSGLAEAISQSPDVGHLIGAVPHGFFWGVASAGFQCEGSSPDSNWLRRSNSGKVDDPVSTAVDFRHRYRSDIELARQMGVTVYRVSVEWARIEPKPGVLDQRELAYYDDMIGAIVAAGMRPMITIDHWVYPGWAADRGGWANAHMPDWWLANATRVVERYIHHKPLWITINEPTTYLSQEIQIGMLPAMSAGVMAERLVGVHRRIYDHIHRLDGSAMVSSNVAYIPTAETIIDIPLLDKMADKLDFIGVDYYHSVSVSDTSAWHAAAGDPWNASASADGLYYALRHYAWRYPKLPLYVVETGMATDNGKPRSDGYRRGDQLRDLIYWTQRARADGMNVIGFNYWSLTDNYEWGSYRPRLGLYTVDVVTDRSLRRRPTDGVDAYRQTIASRGVGSAYTPTRPADSCSLADAPDSCTQPVH